MSRSVAVIVITLLPLAAACVGVMMMVELAAFAGAGVKERFTTSVRVIPSPTTRAVTWDDCAVVERTVACNCPAASVSVTGCVTVMSTPVACKCTSSPASGFACASVRVTVSVAASRPSAMTLLLLVVNWEASASTGPTVNVTVAVCCNSSPRSPRASRTCKPTLVDVITAVTTPLLSLSPT